jgi:hypothetical protein
MLNFKTNLLMRFKHVLPIVLIVAAIAVIISCSEDNALNGGDEAQTTEAANLKAAGDCGWYGSYPYCCDCNADPDGDGWGWEWNRSCRMGNCNSGGGSCGTCGSYPYCCNSGSDPDGDGWGWENNQSCIVPGSSVEQDQCGGSSSSSSSSSSSGGGSCGTCGSYPLCCSSSSDPDGDGWGWENNQSCIVSGSQAANDQCGGGSSSSSGGSSGSCPSSLSCPGGMSCGCYTVSGLGSNKQAYINAGANRSFLASAMMETEQMNTNYAYGDNKTGDAFNAGACKQNWYMMRHCHSAWNNLGSGDYNTGAALNNNRSLDNQVYQECRNYYGSNWWAGHRGGESGLNNPNCCGIPEFKAGYDWTYNQIGNHMTDDVRFWVDIYAI